MIPLNIWFSISFHPRTPVVLLLKENRKMFIFKFQLDEVSRPKIFTSIILDTQKIPYMRTRFTSRFTINFAQRTTVSITKTYFIIIFFFFRNILCIINIFFFFVVVVKYSLHFFCNYISKYTHTAPPMSPTLEPMRATCTHRRVQAPEPLSKRTRANAYFVGFFFFTHCIIRNNIISTGLVVNNHTRVFIYINII